MTVRKSLRILLSAYACEPGRGSEPGVGWNWAVTLAAQGHKVWVLTRTNNKQSIEAAVALLDRSVRDNLHFVFHDLPRWARWWKKGGRGVHLYFSLWQLTLLSVAKKLAQEVQFDVAHHLTFGVWRQSSHLYKLNVPLIFGPVGGGESAPWRLVRTLPAADQVKEVIDRKSVV